MVQVCKDDCKINNNTITDDSFFIYFDKQNENVVIQSAYVGKCRVCNHHLQSKVEFIEYIPEFIFIETAKKNIIYNELPKEIAFGKQKFKLLCATIKSSKNQHLVSTFEFNQKTNKFN